MRFISQAPRLALLWIATAGVLFLAGCGGGGGGGGGGSASVLRGIVLDSATGDTPVEGATVTIGGVTATTRTRDNADAQNNVGTFAIVNAPNGSNTAVITPPGGSAQTVAFEPAVGSRDNADLELFINIGQVRGRVLLPNGQPATNAFVTIGATAETRQVNPDGTFLLELVPVGDTEVFAVQATASATRSVTVNVGLNNAGDISLVDDPNPNPPGQPNTITGAVTVAGLGTVAGTNVILFRDGIQIEETLTNGTGQYGFFVPPGNYSVRALRTGFQDANSGPLVLTDPNSPLRADLTLVER